MSSLETFGRYVYEDRSRLRFSDFFFLADCGRGDPPKDGGSVNANNNAGKVGSQSAGANGWIVVTCATGRGIARIMHIDVIETKKTFVVFELYYVTTKWRVDVLGCCFGVNIGVGGVGLAYSHDGKRWEKKWEKKPCITCIALSSAAS